MSKTKSGKEQLKETADRLRVDKKAVDKKTLAKKKEVEGELAVVRGNEKLMQMYQDNARVGSENIGSSLPMLKIHSTNKSLGNELADGTEPNNGWFYYSKTKEQFENVTCRILTISKGFRTDGMMDKKTGKRKTNVFNQLLGGVIINDGKLLPFIAYFTGIKLNNLWEFGKDAHKYTHAKPVPIPMFALTVELTTEMVTHNFGSSPVMKFKILKDKDGGPRVVTDTGEFVFLRDLVGEVGDTIASLIDSKSTEEGVDRATVVEVVGDEPVKAHSEVNIDVDKEKELDELFNG